MRKFASLLAVLAFCVSLAFAQTKTVTGRVTDQQGQPIPFATVHLKGTKQAVSADADGVFSIKAKPGDALVITGAGVTAKEIPVDNLTSLVIQVTRKEGTLSEVVVTALGVQRQSKELGYSTAK